MKILTYPLTELSVRSFARLQTILDFDPAYQREGGIWDDEGRQLLIDSIINGLDVPKVYFEKISARRFTPGGLTYQYAVIDGKQRLGAITAYLSNDLSLHPNFRFFEDPGVHAENLTLDELSTKYPLLAGRLLDFLLPVVVVESDSDDLVEEMFQRLNASSALNAAERRNAVGGPTRDAANQLSLHPLLQEQCPIRNARYKYREFGAKFLAIENQFDMSGRVVDTKAQRLLDLFRASKGTPPAITSDKMLEYRTRATATLDAMNHTFIPEDPLLASVGTVIVYYLVFRAQHDSGGSTERQFLQDFEDGRRVAARMSELEEDYADTANVRLREYNSLVQSTNDGGALMRRAAILEAFLLGAAQGDGMAGVRTLAEDDSTDATPSEEGIDSAS